MIPAILLSVLVAAVPAPGAQGSPTGKTVDLLPAANEIEGWQAGERMTYASNRALYDYMDGGAEVYIDYGFQDLAVGEWTSPEGEPLRVEIYRLGQPKSAYGMYTQDTWGDEVDIGQGGRLQGGTLRFWKGPYLVRVFMWRGYKDHLDVILDAGRSVAEKIEPTGEVPGIVGYLPAEGLADGGVHFFHTALTLGTFYYLAEGNPLELSRETDGVIGEYLLEDGSPVFLVLISYPDPARAAKAFDGFLKSESPAVEGASKDPAAATLVYDDGTVRSIRVSGSFVGLALDFPPEGEIAVFLDRMMAGLDEKNRAGEVSADQKSKCED